MSSRPDHTPQDNAQPNPPPASGSDMSDEAVLRQVVVFAALIVLVSILSMIFMYVPIG